MACCPKNSRQRYFGQLWCVLVQQSLAYRISGFDPKNIFSRFSQDFSDLPVTDIQLLLVERRVLRAKKDWLAMGSTLSSVLTNFLWSIVSRRQSIHSITNQRYGSDTWTTLLLDQFLEHLNALHSSIHFTMEILLRRPRVSHTVYRKPTQRSSKSICEPQYLQEELIYLSIDLILIKIRVLAKR